MKAKTWNLNVLCIIFSQVIRKKEHNTVNIMHPPKSIHFFISMTLLISLLLFLVWHCLHFYQLLVFVLIHFARKVQEKMIRHYLQNYITVSQLKPVLIRVLTGFIKWGNKIKNFTCISLLINRSQLIKTGFLRNLDQILYIMVYYPIILFLKISAIYLLKFYNMCLGVNALIEYVNCFLCVFLHFQRLIFA